MVILNCSKIGKDRYCSGVPRINRKQNEVFVGRFNEKKVNVD